MQDDWKARIRAVYGRLCRAEAGQLRNYGVLRSWQSATDWARAVANLPPGFTPAAVADARADFAEFDVGVLRAGVGDHTDLRLKHDVQYWAASSLITKHLTVAIDVLQRSLQPNRPLPPPAGLVTREAAPAMPQWPSQAHADRARGPWRDMAVAFARSQLPLAIQDEEGAHATSTTPDTASAATANHRRIASSPPK